MQKRSQNKYCKLQANYVTVKYLKNNAEVGTGKVLQFFESAQPDNGKAH